MQPSIPPKDGRTHLVLTRTRRESFELTTSDGAIDIEVVEVRGRFVRLSILAPPQVQICRDDAKVLTSRRRGKGAEDQRSKV